MSAARRPGSGVEAASAKAVRKPPQALAGTSFGRAVPEPDGASRQVLRQRTFPARFCVLSRKCLSGGFVQPGTHFSTTEAALPRRTPVRFADWIEPKQGERRRVAGRLTLAILSGRNNMFREYRPHNCGLSLRVDHSAGLKCLPCPIEGND